ncbi:hypothetical protein HXX01_01880 [Candidatus Nomurabacteria bacterium]|nr:hypothetical protein [Candidatus Nomurabacteria bacterium]
MKKEIEVISIREFARRLGFGEKTIRDAIRLKKISKGLTHIKGKPKILYEVAKKEVDAFMVGSKSTQPNKATKQPKKTTPGLGEVGFITYAEALRQGAIWKARLAELDVLEREKVLVKKEEVYSQLAEHGTMIRIEFESMPFKVGPKLAACGGDLTKITDILSKEIYNSLLKISTQRGNVNIG